jgi:hypothetical protein
MPNRLTLSVFCVLVGLMLSGCEPPAAPVSSTVAESAPPPRQPTGPTPVFADEAIGLQLMPVPDTELKRDFDRKYLDTDGWKAFAPGDSEGKALAALVLDGSNDLTAAELRIGSSGSMREVGRCLEAPPQALGLPDQVEIGGVAFAHFRASDAAMSHFLQIEGYRSVRNGRCVAMDLMVSGTRPEVYDPPRKPPFGASAAMTRLHQALTAVHWK